MKILFFVQTLALGGVLRQISILADHLTRRGHDVSVLALYTKDQNWKLLWKLDSIHVRSLLARKPAGVLSAGIQALKAALQLRSLLGNENVQILYSYQGHSGRFIAWLATRTMPDTKLIWGIRGSGQRHTSYRSGWKTSLLFRLCKWVSRSVPLMIANSEAGYTHRKASGYRCIKQMVIPNGFDTDHFRLDPEARIRVRSEWKVKNERLIGSVARLHPSKGHRVFLEAAASLSTERKDLRFVIVGDGADRRQLELLSRQLGVIQTLIWAGARDDMCAVYNALDILCSSSIGGEGFPNVIGEAMACGVPCVVTDVGDSVKVVGNEGIVVSPGDPQMLASALNTMLLRLENIKPLEIRERIARHFGLDAMVDATEKALIEICTTT